MIVFSRLIKSNNLRRLKSSFTTELCSPWLASIAITALTLLLGTETLSERRVSSGVEREVSSEVEREVSSEVEEILARFSAP